MTSLSNPTPHRTPRNCSYLTPFLMQEGAHFFKSDATISPQTPPARWASGPGYTGCHPLLLPTPRGRKADHQEEAQRPPGAGRLCLGGKEAARTPCQLHSHPSLLGTGWGRELTTAGPGQVPGAADVHEGARRPIRPAGIVIKGPVAEQAWCSGMMASESQPGWGTSPQSSPPGRLPGRNLCSAHLH